MMRPKTVFNIVPIKTKPSKEPTVIINGLLKKKEPKWIKAELKNRNLRFDTYFAFEENGNTFLYARAG